MDKMFIANRITELRLKKNVSEYQMSLDLGRNKSYIQSLSSGRNNPTMENFLEICEYFEITPAQFLIRILQIHRFIQKHLILSNSWMTTIFLH